MGRSIDRLLRQQAALATFGTFAFREDDLTKVLNAAARICAESLNVRHCKICRYRKAENDLLIEAGFGWDDGVIGHVISRADESSPQGRAFVTGQPVIVLSLQESNGYVAPAFYAQHQIVSTVDVIIQSRAGPPFGVLEIDSTKEHAYDVHDIDFLTGFANVLAEAVATASRAGLLQQTLGQMEVVIQEKDQLLAEKGILTQELQHRVRNNLHLIQGMLNDQLTRTSDEAGRCGLRGIIRRVMTLAQVYDHLLGVGMSGTIEFGTYVERLCASLPNIQPSQPHVINLVCNAEHLEMDLVSATALGLVIAELVSNSYEHAFEQRGGSIEVSVRRDHLPDGGIVTIRDTGVGYAPAVAETKRHGVGLARRLMQQVEGTLDVTVAGGTIWTLGFPLTPLPQFVPRSK